MPDKVQDKSSQTGEIARVEVEPRLKLEILSPLTEEDRTNIGSSTGVMRIITESKRDDSADSDPDQPTQ